LKELKAKEHLLILPIAYGTLSPPLKGKLRSTLHCIKAIGMSWKNLAGATVISNRKFLTTLFMQLS
jgi:hypothetical protein